MFPFLNSRKPSPCKEARGGTQQRLQTRGAPGVSQGKDGGATVKGLHVMRLPEGPRGHFPGRRFFRLTLLSEASNLRFDYAELIHRIAA